MTLKIESPDVTHGPFRLGEWLVEPRLNRLTRDAESIQIELKMMDVLVCLAEHAGELVERQQLIDTVWATDFISENILTRAIAELRRTLGDDAKEPRYIETIHRKGYRLIAAVEPVGGAAAKVHPFPTPAAHPDDERSPYPGLAAFSEAANRNVGASFRARPRIHPESNAVEMARRRWRRVLSSHKSIKSFRLPREVIAASFMAVMSSRLAEGSSESSGRR